MFSRDIGQKYKGFTLLEVLVSLAVAGTLLGAFGLALRGVCQDLSQNRRMDIDTQYQRAIDLMAADARGIICIDPTTDESSRYGRCLARFVSTHRVNAIHDGQWAGTTRVGYWLAEDDSGNKLLWRCEATTDDDRANQTWTCLMDAVVDFRVELLGDDDWRAWPKSKDEIEKIAHRTSLRLVVVATDGPRHDIRQLPVAIMPVMVNVLNNSDSFTQRGGT